MFRFHKLKYSSNHAILAKLMDAVSLENLGMLSILPVQVNVGGPEMESTRSVSTDLLLSRSSIFLIM